MKATLSIALTALVVAVGPTFAQDAKSILQKGLFAEEAEQDFDNATKHYEKLIADFDAQRAFAVAALYRLAEVRRKQERNNDAAVLYQRILAEFPSADPQARLSRENLKAMGIAIASTEKEAPKDPVEEKELRRLAMLAENNPERIWDEVVLSPHTKRKENPLSRAARLGRHRVLGWMIDQAKSVDRDIVESVDAALRAAVEEGALESCRLLLARGADIHAADGMLGRAIFENHEDVAKWLVDSGANINTVGEVFVPIPNGGLRDERDIYTGEERKVPIRVPMQLSSLGAAIAGDDKYWVDRLLKAKADVNATVDKGSTMSALAVACWKGHAPLVRKLLNLGADPNNGSNHGLVDTLRPIPSYGNWSPLHYAATGSGMVTALIEAGADATVAAENGLTPLHCACDFDDLDNIRALIKAGADVNAVASLYDSRNRGSRFEVTPIIAASGAGDTKAAMAAIDLLVENGGDLFARTKTGQDVFALCWIPETRAAILEKYVYPQRAKKSTLR